MDLSELDTVQEGVPLVVRNPGTNEPLTDDEGKPLILFLLSADSDSVRRAQRKVANERLQSGRGVPTVEEAEEKANQLLAQATTGISGKWLLEGKEVKFSQSVMVELYTRFPWLKRQADDFIHIRANFLKGSSKT